jgi:hypothetical protein
VTSYLYSTDNLQFYRDRVRWCLELAEASRSVPAIKIRLEALARKYRFWIDELEAVAQTSPQLAADNYDKKASAPQFVDQFEEERSDSFMAA